MTGNSLKGKVLEKTSQKWFHVAVNVTSSVETRVGPRATMTSRGRGDGLFTRAAFILGINRVGNAVLFTLSFQIFY